MGKKSKPLVTNLQKTGDFLIDSLCVRYQNFAEIEDWSNSWDPRRIEQEILLDFKGSTMQSSFIKANPLPVCLMAGRWGARRPPMPSYMRLKSGDSLISTIINVSDTDIEHPIELTYSGIFCGDK